MMIEPLKNLRINGRFIFKNAPKIAKDVQELETVKEPSKEEVKIPEQKPDQVFKKFSLDDLKDYVPSSDPIGDIINYLA